MNHEQSQLHAWLAELGSRQGAQFQLDDQGRCSISANENTSIVLYGPAGNDIFYINVELLPLPEEGQEQLFRLALNLNLFQQETLGAAIALDEESTSLILCYSREYGDTSFQDFSNTLNNMVALSDTLRLQLEDACRNEPSEVREELPEFGLLC